MLASVKESIPTRREAEVALAEARNQARRVRGTDQQFRPVLIIVAAAYLAAGVVLGLSPRGGLPYQGTALLVILLGGLAVGLVLLWRIRAYSRWGLARFSLSIAACSIWNAAVIGVSTISGWESADQPGFHVTVSFAVAALPLVVAAWLIGRTRA
jgi:hypothetical protein